MQARTKERTQGRWGRRTVAGWAAAVLAVSLAAGWASAQWASGTAFTVSSPGSSARGAAISADGRYVYVATVHDKSLVKLEASTGRVVAQADLTGADPGAWGKAAWVDGSGRVWAPLTAPRLALYAPDLELLAAYDLSGFGIVDPEGVAVSAAGEVYVTDRKGKGGVYKFRLEGNRLALVQEWGNGGHVAVGADLRQPALAANGDLLVGSFGGAEIYRIAAATGTVSMFARGVTTPFHLAVDAAGRVFVAHYDRRDAGLTVLGPDGTVVGTWTARALGVETEVAGVAVSADGNTLYLVDQRPGDGGKVRVYRWQ